MDNKFNYIKRESVIGLPVIDAKSQKHIGIVKDIYTNEKGTHIDGMYITCNGWGRNDIDVPFIGTTIGTDTIIAEGEILSGVKHKNGDSIEKLLKKHVVREDGQGLGVISDLLLDPLTGRIEGLEISEGLIDDLLKGRQMMPYLPYEQGNGDVIVISMEQAEKCRPYNKGIKNMLNLTGEDE